MKRDEQLLKRLLFANNNTYWLEIVQISITIVPVCVSSSYLHACVCFSVNVEFINNNKAVSGSDS